MIQIVLMYYIVSSPPPRLSSVFCMFFEKILHFFCFFVFEFYTMRKKGSRALAIAISNSVSEHRITFPVSVNNTVTESKKEQKNYVRSQMRAKGLPLQSRLLLLRQVHLRFAGHRMHDLRKVDKRHENGSVGGIHQARQLRRHIRRLHRALPVQPLQ